MKKQLLLVAALAVGGASQMQADLMGTITAGTSIAISGELAKTTVTATLPKLKAAYGKMKVQDASKIAKVQAFIEGLQALVDAATAIAAPIQESSTLLKEIHGISMIGSKVPQLLTGSEALGKVATMIKAQAKMAEEGLQLLNLIMPAPAPAFDPGAIPPAPAIAPEAVAEEDVPAAPAAPAADELDWD